MKKQIITYLILITLFNVNLGYSQFIGSGSTAPGNLTTLNNIGIGTTGATNAKLELLSTSNQLRLSRTGTIFSDINTTATGLNLNSNTGNISFGNPTITKIIHFNSNIGGSGDVPAGASITSPMTASNEGLSLYSSGSASSLAKLGAYAYSSAGWKSMWETANVNSIGQLPNLLLAKSGGNVGIGTGATAPDKLLTVKSTIANTQIAKFADNARYIGLGRDEVAAFDLAGNPANLYVGGQKLNILTTGEVGIGTTTPYKKLSVVGDVAFGTNSGVSSFEILGNGQIPSKRGISIDNDPSGKFNFYIHSSQTNAGFNFKNGNGDKTLVSISSIGATTFSVLPTSPSIAADALIVNDATTNTTNFKVKTDGKVYAREVNVQLTNFPDYVFANEYKLTPLNEVESYININKHLKGFEPAKNYENNGMNVGEVVKLQQEKIEELTLYLIEQQKQLNEMKKQIESSKK